MSIQKKIKDLTADFQKIANHHFYLLEIAQNMSLQYGRRDTFEISGVPQDIPQKSLEDEIIDILREAKV